MNYLTGCGVVQHEFQDAVNSTPSLIVRTHDCIAANGHGPVLGYKDRSVPPHSSPRTRPRLSMDTITYRAYSGEHELPHIISLVQGELSEPYVVYTYRYFLHQWSVPTFFSLTPHDLILIPSFHYCRPHLSFLVRLVFLFFLAHSSL